MSATSNDDLRGAGLYRQHRRAVCPHLDARDPTDGLLLLM